MFLTRASCVLIAFARDSAGLKEEEGDGDADEESLLGCTPNA